VEKKRTPVEILLGDPEAAGKINKRVKILWRWSKRGGGLTLSLKPKGNGSLLFSYDRNLIPARKYSGKKKEKFKEVW